MKKKLLLLFIALLIIIEIFWLVPYTRSRVTISSQNVPHQYVDRTEYHSLFWNGYAGYSFGGQNFRVFSLDYKRLVIQLIVTVLPFLLLSMIVPQQKFNLFKLLRIDLNKSINTDALMFLSDDEINQKLKKAEHEITWKYIVFFSIISVAFFLLGAYITSNR